MLVVTVMNDFDTLSSAELVAYIVEHCHSPLREELPRLEGLAQKVLQVHGYTAPDRLRPLASVVSALRAHLETHLDKEEKVIFPRILARSSGVSGPIGALVHDHSAIDELLRSVRTLTMGYVSPEGACASWRALYRGLRHMDEQLQHLLHLEDELLYPLALSAA